MKKYLSLVIALVCLLSLCACGGSKTEEKAQPSAAPVVTAEPAAEVSAPTEEPAQPTEAPVVEQKGPSAYEQARALEGESVDALIAAVGEPLSREDYAPSCLGDGEDGIWHYDGFDVYTYREGENESVYAVMEG